MADEAAGKINGRPVAGTAEERAQELQRRLNAAAHFPDQNPHPVLRIDAAGALIYSNPASRVLMEDLGLQEGALLPDLLLKPLREAMAGPEGSMAEVEVGRRTFSFKPVTSEAFDYVNIYATDITASRAIQRFPERNPNPVLRVGDDGTLQYANAASAPVVAAMDVVEGHRLPDDLWQRLCASAAAEAAGEDVDAIEIQGDGRWYDLRCVPIPEFSFSNVYGTDITALKALTRFPNQNPNPVIRVTHEGQLLFANDASEHIVEAFGLAEGEMVPAAFMDPIRQDIKLGQCTFEIEAGQLIYRMVAVAAFEFGFINIYGTDITADKQVAAAHQENERLLLNILPAPIAERLRNGESVIADRHEDLSLLFADIVGFTQMSSDLPAHEVVDLLDDLFRHLDELVDTYQLEKIKTIGDAYMVVGGLPPATDDHLARVAAMALDLNGILTTRADKHPITMRIGMHAGPAVAGVIGAKKFIYDVWGDTVNTASRLESNGLPQTIQVTDTVQQRLDDRFLFEPRGIVDLKGMGPTHTWFLRGRRDGVGVGGAHLS